MGNGITPNGRGYGQQNPRVLAAFDALDRAYASAQQAQTVTPAGAPHGESPQAFQQRIQREVMGR